MLDVSQFHQEEPRLECRHPTRIMGCKCRDPRCSLRCRQNWAYKEARIVELCLASLPTTTHLYFGVLKVLSTISLDVHKSVRRNFLTLLSDIGAKIYATSEVGRDRRVHYHYVLYSDNVITQQKIKQLWNEACPGYRTIVSHREARSIQAGVRYTFKDLKEPGGIKLFRRGSLRITWGHTRRTGFFARSKASYWEDHKSIIKEQYGRNSTSVSRNNEEHSPTKQWRLDERTGSGTDSTLQRTSAPDRLRLHLESGYSRSNITGDRDRPKHPITDSDAKGSRTPQIGLCQCLWRLQEHTIWSEGSGMGHRNAKPHTRAAETCHNGLSQSALVGAGCGLAQRAHTASELVRSKSKRSLRCRPP